MRSGVDWLTHPTSHFHPRSMRLPADILTLAYLPTRALKARLTRSLLYSVVGLG